MNSPTTFLKAIESDMVSPYPPRISLMGVPIDMVDRSGLFNRVLAFVRDGNSHKVAYVNAHCMVVSQKDVRYRKILNKTHFVYADGMGVVWGARLLGCNLPGRLTAADFMPGFFSLCAKKKLKVFFLGADPGVAEEARENLLAKIPALRIVGTEHGYFQADEGDAIVNKINEVAPDILMVGMGIPYQEKWIDAHFDRIDVPVVWGVGALFDFLSGRLSRGPQWLLDSGFEWLCRLFVEPGRLWRRYLVENALFVLYIMRCKARTGRKSYGGS